MDRDDALEYLQDESYAFQQLEDELCEIETSGDVGGISKKAKVVYAQMEEMIIELQNTGQLLLF